MRDEVVIFTPEQARLWLDQRCRDLLGIGLDGFLLARAAGELDESDPLVGHIVWLLPATDAEPKPVAPVPMVTVAFESATAAIRQEADREAAHRAAVVLVTALQGMLTAAVSLRRGLAPPEDDRPPFA
jgi:hypothetical protein